MCPHNRLSNTCEDGGKVNTNSDLPSGLEGRGLAGEVPGSPRGVRGVQRPLGVWRPFGVCGVPSENLFVDFYIFFTILCLLLVLLGQDLPVRGV